MDMDVSKERWFLLREGLRTKLVWVHSWAGVRVHLSDPGTAPFRLAVGLHVGDEVSELVALA